ncbi:hypothetical protein D3C87_1141480 [compost metagenome]
MTGQSWERSEEGCTARERAGDGRVEPTAASVGSKRVDLTVARACVLCALSFRRSNGAKVGETRCGWRRNWPRRGLKTELQAAPVFDSLCQTSNCSPVCSPALDVLAFDAISGRVGALREGIEAECDLAGGNPIARATLLRRMVGGYAAIACSRSQAVTSPARQRVHRAPFLIG